MIPLDTSIVDTINQAYAVKNGDAVTHIFLAGIGGSHLGAQAVHDAVSTLPYAPGVVNFYSLAAIDSALLPELITLYEHILVTGQHVMLIVVSKSGRTFETGAHASLLFFLLKKYRPQTYRDHVLVVTDENSVLLHECQREQLTVVTVPQALGGRYSIFSAAGLLVLKFLKINIVELLAGAACVSEHEAHESARELYQVYKRNYLVHDIFTFMPRYASLALWYRQLIGESLGKQGKGFLATVSTAQDVHSVIQQYFGGKQIMYTSFMIPVATTVAPALPVTLFSRAAQLPEGLTFPGVQDCIVQGVISAYEQAKKPFSIHEFKPGSLYDIGKFMQLKMLETIFLGKLMAVNPFDQPEVELYKQQTRKLFEKYS